MAGEVRQMRQEAILAFDNWKGGKSFYRKEA